MQKHSNKFMIGVIVGSTVGALTTLLFKTNKGKKIQKRLIKNFHETDEKTGHFGIGKFAARYKKMASQMTRRPKKSKSRRAR